MSDNPHQHLRVQFYLEAAPDPIAAAEKGRPVFEDKEFVKIQIAGDKQNVFVGLADDYGPVHDKSGNRLRFKDQFPDHYEAFKKNAAYREAGSPLEVLGFSPAKVAELNAANIYTVEALAGLDGTFLQKLGMGSRELKNQAEAYLKRSTDGTAVNRLQDENAELRRMIEQMQQKMATLTAAPQPTGNNAQTPATLSAFNDYDDETIRVWLEEQGAPKPHHNTGRAKLVQLADEWNAKLAADQNKAA